MTYPLQVLVTLQAVSLFGLVANLASLVYVLKRFDVAGKTAFLLLAIDASVCSFGCAILFAGTILNSCLVIGSTVFLTATLECFILMEISLLRLHAVRNRNDVDERRVRKRALLLLAAPLLYMGNIVLACLVQNVPFSFAIETCLHGDTASKPNILVNVALSVPNHFVVPLVSLAADVAVLFTLKGKTAAANTMDAIIPLRATLLSALTLVGLIVVVLLKQTWTSEFGSATAILITFAVLESVRCSAATFLSFAYKSGREMQSRRANREVRLEKVLQHAREEMNKRRSKTVEEESA